MRASNVSRMSLSDGRVVLFSYRLPVAVFVPGRGVVANETRYSVTTSRHITQFADGATISRVTEPEFKAAIQPVSLERS